MTRSTGEEGISVVLDGSFIRHRDDRQRRIVLGRHDVRLARKCGDALESDAS